MRNCVPLGNVPRDSLGRTWQKRFVTNKNKINKKGVKAMPKQIIVANKSRAQKIKVNFH